MPVRYILSRVWVRLSIFFQLSILQYMGLCVFHLPISLVMIERIYTLSYYHHQNRKYELSSIVYGQVTRQWHALYLSIFLWIRICRYWAVKMLLSHILSSVCLRLYPFSQLSFMQNIGLCVFNLPISLIIIVRMCILYRIIIIKWGVWPICHCLKRGHETMLCAVCLSYSYRNIGTRCQLANYAVGQSAYIQRRFAPSSGGHFGPTLHLWFF